MSSSSVSMSVVSAKKSLPPSAAALPSGGYFTSSGKAVAVAAANCATPLVTVTSLPEAAAAPPSSTGLTSQDLDDLDEMVDLAAVITSVPVPDPTVAAAATWLTPFEARVYRINVKSEGIWIHGEASSAFDPGFRAIVCLDARPAWFLQYLGLPTDLDSYCYLIFLQRTVGPNEMFGRWIEDEAKDEGRAAAGDDRSLIGRRTLRVHLHAYLSLPTMVREEWQAIETRLAAMARQLGCKDQPVATDPGVCFVGKGGVATFQAKFKDCIFFEARHPVASNIWVRLDVRAPGGDFHRMEIPFAVLVAVAVQYHTLYVDLLDKWCNSLRVGDIHHRKRPAAAAAAPAGDLLEMASAVPPLAPPSAARHPQLQQQQSSLSLVANAREKTTGSGKSGHHRFSSSPKHHGKNISKHQRHRKRSGSQSSTASSTFSSRK
jgi:hypothetical protein